MTYRSQAITNGIHIRLSLEYARQPWRNIGCGGTQSGYVGFCHEGALAFFGDGKTPFGRNLQALSLNTYHPAVLSQFCAVISNFFGRKPLILVFVP